MASVHVQSREAWDRRRGIILTAIGRLMVAHRQQLAFSAAEIAASIPGEEWLRGWTFNQSFEAVTWVQCAGRREFGMVPLVRASVDGALGAILYRRGVFRFIPSPISRPVETQNA